MNLDLYLEYDWPEAKETDAWKAVKLLRDNGIDGIASQIEAQHWNVFHNKTRVWEGNITHNLTAMAEAAGLYKVLWRPDENGFTKGSDCIQTLEIGIQKLLNESSKMKMHNPKNGWGDYEGLLEFAKRFLHECKEHPEATVRTSR